MSYGAQQKQIDELAKQVTAIRAKMNELRRSQPPEVVKDYEFPTSTGEKAKLSSLFGDKNDLFVVHNMGRGCSYCTLWADGFSGVLPHLENRAAFVLSSPDSPEVQAQFAKSRGWNFKMVSTVGTSFAKDLGYQGDDNRLQPGVSVFRKTKDGIVRVSDTEFGPGDDYCQVWHLFDLLPNGPADWRPKFAYRD